MASSLYRFMLCIVILVTFHYHQMKPISVPQDQNYCYITACDVLSKIQEKLPLFFDNQSAKYASSTASSNDEDYEMNGIHFKDTQETRLIKLERRLRSVEQTVWLKSDKDDSWYRCCEGPCRCRPEIHTLSCWKQDMEELPFDQIIPADIRVIDLGINQLSTLSKDAFTGLYKLTEL
uniref:Uncharacterized protein n=7 Tax=Cacopsylla melanoneura TaxID=428564 RepID=A0A8D9AU05_9HEMI